MESPSSLSRLKQRLLLLNDYFNLTMTCRRNADIHNSYSHVTRLYTKIWRNKSEQDVVKETNELVKSKTKLAIWIASNCQDTLQAKRRMELTQKLTDEGLSLDKFGKCFNSVIDGNQLPSLIKQYKFYLAFENSLHCRDYITEKFMINSLRYGAVPVVFGATKSDYEAIAPPHSFIFAEDFSPRTLVEYLNYLDKNESAYREYLQWRTILPFNIDAPPSPFCQLCRVVHGINIDNLRNSEYNKSYSRIPLFGFPENPRRVSLVKWWLGTENRECLKYANKPKNTER